MQVKTKIIMHAMQIIDVTIIVLVCRQYLRANLVKCMLHM